MRIMIGKKGFAEDFNSPGAAVCAPGRHLGDEKLLRAVRRSRWRDLEPLSNARSSSMTLELPPRCAYTGVKKALGSAW
jgi:hypothetical protein